MSKCVQAVFALSLAVCPAWAAKEAGSSAKTVAVDCSKGDSINKELATDTSPLTIEISGICSEDVVIERPHVTLRGADPAVDGIQAVAGDAITIRGTFDIRIESLQVTGGARSGIRLNGTGSDIFVDACDIHGNVVNGIELREAFAEVTNSTIDGSGQGINARNQATLRIIDSVVSSSTAAFLVQGGSNALVVRGSATGPRSLGINEGSATVFNTDLAGDIAVVDDGQAFLVDLTLNGGFDVAGQSRLGLFGTTQLSTGLGNAVRQSSTLSIDDGAGLTTLAGDVVFAQFSNGDLENGDLQGLTCDVSSNAVCGGATLAGVSSCSLCP